MLVLGTHWKARFISYVLLLFLINSFIALINSVSPQGWKERWTVPTDWKSASELGEWKHTTGEFNGGSSDDKGIQTSQDARFYGLSAPLDKPFKSSDKKDLVIQYTVKHEQKIDCGGAYLKLLPGGKNFDAKKFGGDTPYGVMFGPDICGSSNKRTHVILHSNRKDENLLIKKNVNTEDNQLSHLYTLVVRPDNTFEVFIDNKSVRSGKLDDEFDFLPAKEIKDPDQSKPADWVDEKRIPDPDDKKPDGWDDIPAEIPDPDASKPDDWDDEDDGEWEPPMVDNPEYKGEWKPKMIDNPEYKGPWNQVHSVARVFTPADTAVQTPNSDTPYSMLGADLRAEPLVLFVPPIADRYYSLQFIDGYTYNFAYVGSRTTGTEGGLYLLAGPDWNGPTPEGVRDVIKADTDFVLVAYRTQLLGPDDLANVQKIQAGYKAEPLSTFLKKDATPEVQPIEWPSPLSPDEQKTSLRFFDLLDFQLAHAPPLPGEEEVRARFASIGLNGDGKFKSDRLSAEMQQAFKAGMADAWAEFAAFKKDEIDTGEVKSGQLFGTRDQLGANYLYRMAGAVIGIYANSNAEAMYPVLSTDSDGAPLTGTNKYTLTFADGQLPPVNAFWSVTMYKLPESLLVDNPINRYVINRDENSRNEISSDSDP